MQRVINFSGGKTSAYMTIHNYKPGDIVLFTDTWREHPKTIEFIINFEKFENIPVIWASYPGGFNGLLKKKKYQILPNRVKRICTAQLKILTAKRCLRNMGIQKFESLIGFRFDEKKRVDEYINKYKKVFPKFPLYENGITKEMINDYWKQKSYTLEIPQILGNCTLCFMKGAKNIENILTLYPELANEWINDEKQAKGRTYLPGITIEQILQRAQNNLFKDIPEYTEYMLSQIVNESKCKCNSF